MGLFDLNPRRLTRVRRRLCHENLHQDKRKRFRGCFVFCVGFCLRASIWLLLFVLPADTQIAVWVSPADNCLCLVSLLASLIQSKTHHVLDGRITHWPSRCEQARLTRLHKFGMAVVHRSSHTKLMAKNAWKSWTSEILAKDLKGKAAGIGLASIGNQMKHAVVWKEGVEEKEDDEETEDSEEKGGDEIEEDQMEEDEMD